MLSVADITVDPERLRFRAAELARLADALAGAAALARASTGEGGLFTADLAARHHELVHGLGRDAAELALLAESLRRDADAFDEAECDALTRITAITWGLAGVDVAAGVPRALG